MWRSVAARFKACYQTPARLNLLVALWVTLSCNLIFFKKLYWLNPAASIGFMLASVLLVWAYLNLVLQLLCWGKLGKPLLSLFMLLSTSAAYCMYSFGVGIDVGQVQNLLETDLKEATALFSLGALVFFAAVLFPALYLIWSAPNQQTLGQNLRGQSLSVLLSIAVIGLVAAIYYVDYASLFRENRTLRDYLAPHNVMNGLKKYYQQHQPLQVVPFQHYATDAQRRSPEVQTKPTLMVVVLGETARAESFGLGGYPRNTTPQLSQRQVLYFDQVSACGTSTAASVPCLFSGMQRAEYDDTLAKHREGLLDILQRVGYQVAWIDNNSGCKGACDRVSSVALLEAAKPTWCAGRDYCLDEILVETLADYLSRQPVADRVIVLHQIGSHGPSYYQRYPQQMTTFKPTCDSNAIQNCDRQALINSYDNSIVYTDHVLSRLIDQLATDTRYQSSLLYLSDHGESTGENGLYLHGAPYVFAPSQQTHVPMLAWFSSEFTRQHSEKIRCLRQKQHAKLSHDYFFHTVLGLSQVNTTAKVARLDLTECPN